MHNSQVKLGHIDTLGKVRVDAVPERLVNGAPARMHWEWYAVPQGRAHAPDVKAKPLLQNTHHSKGCRFESGALQTTHVVGLRFVRQKIGRVGRLVHPAPGTG